MPVLSKKALLVLFLYLLGLSGGIQGVQAAAVPRETPQAESSTALTAAMLSSTPTSFVSTPTAFSTATSVPDYADLATEAPVPTSAPEFSEDYIVAAAITVPIPVISIQTWSINPSLRIEEDFSHEHKTSKVSKEDDSWTYGGGSPASSHNDIPKWGMPDADSKGTVKAATGPDANGYVPPVYNGPVHGNELPKLIKELNATDLINLAAAADEAPSGWKLAKDLWGGSKEPQTASTGELGHPLPKRPALSHIDRTEDDTIPSVFGGPEEGHINGKNINPVSPPKPGAGWSQQGGAPQLGHTGSSTVTVKDGFKISEGGSDVETKAHGDSETGSYTGLGVAEYNKVRKLLDYFHHGKHPLNAVAVMEVVVAEDSAKAAPSVNVTAIEDVKKTWSKHVPRDVVKHRLDVPVVPANKTNSALDIVKHMMEAPAAKNNALKKVLEVVYDKLNKTSSAAQGLGITKHPMVDPKPVSASPAQPTTLLTVTRAKTAHKSSSDDVADAPTPTLAAELYPIEDYYHIYARGFDEEGITVTFHAHAAARTSTSSWVQATQDASSHTKSYPHDADGAHYKDSEAATDESLDRMEDSPVFDDPQADDDTNADVHDELHDLKDESKEMSQEIDDEFKHEFGPGGV